MGKSKILILFLICISITSLVSASEGLIAEPNSFEIEKTYGEDLEIVFNLTNTESFNFTNINFEDNDFISMDKINILEGGNFLEVIATIHGDKNIDEELEIEGYYYSEDIGDKDENQEVILYDDETLNIEDFSIYSGAEVTFINNRGNFARLSLDGDINKQIDLEDGESHTEKFENAEDIYYQFRDIGYSLTNKHKITVLPTSGLVINPEKNAKIDLKIDIIFPDTEVIIDYYSNDELTIDPFDSRKENIILRNIGEEKAKNIKLEGDWFSFSENNFDLSSGEDDTKNIEITISPQIPHTNQTNKTYEKELKISGNFQSVNKTFSIFVPYTIIDEDSYAQGKSLIDWITEFCNMDPNHEICVGRREVIYRDKDENITIETGTKQFQEFVSFMVSKVRTLETKTDQQAEIIARMNESRAEEMGKLDQIHGSQMSLRDELSERSDILVALVVLGFLISIAILLFLIIKFLKDKNKLPHFLEKSWKAINKNE